MSGIWPWVTLALLGAYHGLNPGMGWLFALSLGLQEKTRLAILKALLPISLGHAVAISLTILALRIVQETVSPGVLRIAVAAALFGMGLYRLLRARHPRGGGMRVGFGDLFSWSFLMAAAHGAGLMLAPILLAQPMPGMNHSLHSLHNGAPAVSGLSVRVLGVAVMVHTLGLVLVSGTLALVVYQSYETSGLRLLQRAWFNFDLLWAVVLFVAGIAALFL
jgi:hypothetical protein